MNNYGQVTALTYLNTLTKDWAVENINSYKYVNNRKSTVKPFGYREVEIENGITTITQFNGNKVTIEGETKARLMTVEEVLEVASKLNPNLTEENLMLFIQNNLSKMNDLFNTNASTVSELIETVEFPGKQGNKLTHKNLYAFVYSVPPEIEYDIVLPKFMYKNLGGENGPYQHWTLSSGEAPDSVFIVFPVGYIVTAPCILDTNIILRPVITISKSQL